MNEHRAIQLAVTTSGSPAEVVAVERLSGGCIHGACRVGLSDGSQLVVKLGPEEAETQFNEESAGLAALRSTGVVLVPRPVYVGVHDGLALILMSWIDPARPTAESWHRLGSDLARLHQAPAGGMYGFAHDNHIGATQQVNTWMDDWVEFNQVCRLGHQLKLAARNARVTGREATVFHRVVDGLNQFIPHHPRPALLHGDLWSGNAIPTSGNRVALIDPGVYVGDGWADIAMMRLFGGFPEECLQAYQRQVEDSENRDTRILVYQLYHLLNHVNLFGRGYLEQAMGVARRLLGQ